MRRAALQNYTNLLFMKIEYNHVCLTEILPLSDHLILRDSIFFNFFFQSLKKIVEKY